MTKTQRYQAAYYRAHKAERAAYFRAWKQKNREKWAKYMLWYRRGRRENETEGIDTDAMRGA